MSTFFKDTLYNDISKGLSKKENTLKVKKIVSKYIDTNMIKLSTTGPVYKTIFDIMDKKRLYDVCEVTEEQVVSILKKNPYIKGHWRIMNDPFNSVSALSIRFYLVNNNKDIATMLSYYLILSMYPSLHSKYFKYGVNEQIMSYTINNLSNKFKIKQVGSLLPALQETALGSLTHHSKNIIRGTDKDIVDFIMDLKTRANSFLLKIAKNYYENNENKLYLNSDSDSMDSDNYHEADSNVYLIERMTNNVVLKLTVNGPDMKLITTSAKLAQVSVNELRNYINTLVIGENKQEIKDIVESILYLYLYDEKNRASEINSNKFFLECLEIYKKSNTTNPNIIKIKSILDEWLNRVGIYKKTQRLATLNNFRRALYIFFVISIMST